MSVEWRLELCAESIAPSRICAQLQLTCILTMLVRRSGRRRPCRRQERRRRRRIAHPHPDETAGLAAGIGPVLVPPVRAFGWAAPTGARRCCRPRRSSSRGRGSAGRIPRCGRARATRGGAGSARPARRAGRRCRGRPRGLRREGARARARRRAPRLPPRGRRASSGRASGGPSAHRPRPGTAGRCLRQ